ncbi:MAG TPA: helix-hairpin-helix domain-containing protein [Lacipirellulaceae bacterium]|jgi:DNA uptake protein ComE-like DNA-binding protein
MTIAQVHRSRWLVTAIGMIVFGLTIALAASRSVAADTKTKEKVDLNTASEKDLQELPGVGEATAKKIIAGRPYKSVSGLAKAGVNETEIDKLKGLVTATEPKAPVKPETKSTDKGKAADNGKMTGGSKMADADKDKSAKMDAKSGKDAMAKSTDKPADKMAAKIDLNTASDKELMELPGIADANAKKIIGGRPYKSVEDLSKAGINEAEITKLKPLVMISEAKAPAKMDSKMTGSDSKSSKKTDKATGADKSAKNEKDKTPEPVTPPPTDKEIKDATAKKMVWANLNSKVYHESGDRWYGKTHHGRFMTEDEAKKEGYTKAHMNENSDEAKSTK